MTKKIYAVWDHIAQDIAGGILQLHAHEAAAIRSFTDIVLTPGSTLAKHPNDFALVYLGEVTGTVIQHTDPNIILNAAQVIAAQPKETQS